MFRPKRQELRDKKIFGNASRWIRKKKKPFIEWKRATEVIREKRNKTNWITMLQILRKNSFSVMRSKEVAVRLIRIRVMYEHISDNRGSSVNFSYFLTRCYLPLIRKEGLYAWRRDFHLHGSNYWKMTLPLSVPYYFFAIDNHPRFCAQILMLFHVTCKGFSQSIHLSLVALTSTWRTTCSVL